MRILFLSSIFPDRVAATRGTFNSALCRELARRHAVRVVSPRLPEESITWRGRRQVAAPENVTKAGIQVSYPITWQTPRMLHHAYGSQMWWSLQRHLRQVAADFRPDAILSYWAHPEGEVAGRLAEICEVPSAVIVGGSDVLVITKEPKRCAKVQAALQRNSAVVTVSEALREKVLELGISEDRAHTVYQGIDASAFHHRTTRDQARAKLGLANDVAHLVWVGRMAPIKGLDFLLQAVRMLNVSGERFVLHLLGDGPLRRQLEQTVMEQGLSHVVKFEGSRPQDQLPDWYRAADLTVLSSVSEGLPNVLRESLACGTPFVSTNVGSIREIAAPCASALVRPGDAQGFAHAIRALLTPEAREAAALYDPRTWTDCAREIAALLERQPQAAARPLKV